MAHEIRGKVQRIKGWKNGWRGQVTVNKMRKYNYWKGVIRDTAELLCGTWRAKEKLQTAKNTSGGRSWVFFREKWNEDARLRDEPLSERTIVQYNGVFDKVEKHLTPVFLDDITLKGLRGLVADLKDEARQKGQGYTGINNFIILIRHSLKWAMNCGYMEDFPIENLMLIDIGKKKIKTNEIKEIELLLKYGTIKERIIVLLGFDCGLRPEEMSNLLWEKLDFNTRFGWISPNPDGWKPKKGKMRQFRMTERLVVELNKLPKTSKYIITTKYNKKYSDTSFSTLYSNFVKRVNKLIQKKETEQIKIVGTCRTLRKNYSTHRQAQGAELRQVSKSMGHADTKVTTKNYTNEQQPELRRLKEQQERQNLLDLDKYEVPLKIEKAT